MPAPPPPALRRLLARLRRAGEPLQLPELAQALLALRAPVPTPLARRLMAAALGRAADSLPERLVPDELRPAEEAAVARVALAAAQFAVVDLETTGLAAERAAILEIGAVRVKRLRLADRFATLVRPPSRIPRAIAALTGIDDAAVAEAPPAQRALASFRRWLERAPRAPLVAHNAAFDARFLAQGFARCALPIYRAPVLCTWRLARRLLPRLARYDLDGVCAHFGIRNPARHRAGGDAEATARVLVELLEVARSRAGLRTIGDLLDFQGRPPARTR